MEISFEQDMYGQDYGYIRYSKEFSYDAPYEFLALYGVVDRAHVYLNGVIFETDVLRGEPAVEISDKHGLIGKTH